MNTLTLNGAAHPFSEGSTVADLVTTVTGRSILATGQPADGGRLGVAVARNADIVPRSQWSQTLVAGGDDVEIVTAVQGG
ncbi:thiamine biosynthesis protein ThiS [Arthrobacter sp. ERGS1:01]|uniref:sulfur carrier protein ThiS n=1 Tax=Arthrobacter sp. ERGS1:01 TaxID=1704044 RepID=UPI0006B53274|nr:sulfur carrier protein ThiS [Arthrobacter sp. ERGS1:01]ALE06742.1 thiamine biosynthesis protein ThiS [Arthrobacter sp. ERGS1:01]